MFAILRLRALLLGALLTLAAHGAGAQVPGADTARGLAATCSGCHGTDGISAGEIPSLAGRDQEELVRIVRDFRTGRRPSTVMQQLAKGFTDEQIEQIANWYSSRKPPAK